MNGFPLEIPIAPEAVRERITGAINRRPRRLLGVLATEPEYVGFVREWSFEIWDRRGKAVHAYGLIRVRGGGSRLELRAALTPRARLLIGICFVLLAVLAAGIGLPVPPPGGPPSWLVAPAGALATAAIFAVSARRQEAQLGRFVRELFANAAS